MAKSNSPSVLYYIYTFFDDLDQSLEEEYLGGYSQPKFGELYIWNGNQMHAFYDLDGINKDKLLHLAGDKDKSSPNMIYLSGNIITRELKERAEKSCANFREEGSLFCERVEEMVYSSFHPDHFPYFVQGLFQNNITGIEELIQKINNEVGE